LAEPTVEYEAFSGKGNEDYELGTGSYKRSTSAVKMVECVNDRMPYIILRGR
jgi:hypothetical protein